MKSNRLHGIRKQKRDNAVRDFEYQHPQMTEAEIGNAFGLSQSTISKILRNYISYSELAEPSSGELAEPKSTTQ